MVECIDSSDDFIVALHSSFMRVSADAMEESWLLKLARILSFIELRRIYNGISFKTPLQAHDCLNWSKRQHTFIESWSSNMHGFIVFSIF